MLATEPERDTRRAACCRMSTGNETRGPRFSNAISPTLVSMFAVSLAGCRHVPCCTEQRCTVVLDEVRTAMRINMIANLRCGILLASALTLGCDSGGDKPKSSQANPSAAEPDAGEPGTNGADMGGASGGYGEPPTPPSDPEPSADAGAGSDAGDGYGDAERFCTAYEPVCGFGETDRYADGEDCRERFNAASAGARSCVEAHLDLASDDPVTHCPHATGQGPCDEQASFCSAYEKACGFGKAGGFVDAADCDASFGAFGKLRKACVISEAALAGSDPDAHCSPASGALTCSDQALFCQVQEDTCGFGGKDRFKDLAACEQAFGDLNADRQTCVLERLDLAQSDPRKHCPESTGEKKPCDK